MDSIKKFANWKNYKPIKSKINATWLTADLNFDWIHTVQTDEVPTDDVWNSYTTDQKYLLSKLHKRWNIPDSSTAHWMCFEPKLPPALLPILDLFKKHNYSFNLLKLTPGHMLAWHFDTYATFVKRKTVLQSDAEKIKRSVIMLTPWDCGQVIQIGDELLSHWSPGSVFTWDSYAWHGTANFGKSDMIVAQVSYLYE